MQLEGVAFADFVQQAVARLHNDSRSRLEKTQDAMSLAIAGGFYAHYLREWLSEFGNIMLQIVFFDDFQKQPQAMMDGICRWLSLDSTCYTSYQFQSANRGFYFKNKFLHCLAVAVNSRSEPFFRAYPGVKRALLRLHMINMQDNPFVLDGESNAFLAKLYAPYNEELRVLLQDNGYRDRLPAWVTNLEHDGQAGGELRHDHGK